jgi:hypothetical protein
MISGVRKGLIYQVELQGEGTLGCLLSWGVKARDAFLQTRRLVHSEVRPDIERSHVRLNQFNEGTTSPC